jgi:glycogen synthase
MIAAIGKASASMPITFARSSVWAFPAVPLFGLVARLVHQKGVDLVLGAAEAIVSVGGQIVVTGMGEKHLEEGLKQASHRFSHSIGVNIGFDERAARRFFASSDFLLHRVSNPAG